MKSLIRLPHKCWQCFNYTSNVIIAASTPFMSQRSLLGRHMLQVLHPNPRMNRWWSGCAQVVYTNISFLGRIVLPLTLICSNLILVYSIEVADAKCWQWPMFILKVAVKKESMVKKWQEEEWEHTNGGVHHQKDHEHQDACSTCLLIHSHAIHSHNACKCSKSMSTSFLWGGLSVWWCEQCVVLDMVTIISRLILALSRRWPLFLQVSLRQVQWKQGGGRAERMTLKSCPKN